MPGHGILNPCAKETPDASAKLRNAPFFVSALINFMKAYKFTKKEYFGKHSFRLGTLYDYRREEAYGSAIGDAREGTFDRQYQFPFKTTDQLINRLTTNQRFAWVYAKGEKNDRREKNRYLINFVSANLLVFSASLIPDDFLFDEFSGSDCCVEISDFGELCAALMRDNSLAVEKTAIRECTYTDRIVVNDDSPMPPLPFVKDKRYAKQKEIRFCVQLFGDPPGGIILNSLDAWQHCKILKSISP